MHVPRVLLLGDWDEDKLSKCVPRLVGRADVVVRRTPGDWRPKHVRAALPHLIPVDGPAFHAAWLAADVDDWQADGAWPGLDAVVAQATGVGGGRLYVSSSPPGSSSDPGRRLGGWSAHDEAGVLEALLASLGGAQPAQLPEARELDGSPDPGRAMREWVARAGRPEHAPAAAFAPAPGPRAAPLTPATAALLVVDAQNFNCHAQGALYHPERGGGDGHARVSEAERAHFFERLGEPGGAADCWAALLAAGRAAGLFVLHTVIAAQDGRLRDTGLDYRLSGFRVPPGCWDAAPVPAAAPARGEPVLPKTTSSPFASTPILSMLRSAGITQLVVAGCVTDQCIAATVVDAADAGVLVTLVRDACLTYTQDRHDAALKALSGYGRQVDTADVVRELGG